MIPPGGGDIRKSMLVHLDVLGTSLILYDPLPEISNDYAHYS